MCTVITIIIISTKGYQSVIRPHPLFRQVIHKAHQATVHRHLESDAGILGQVVHLEPSGRGPRCQLHCNLLGQLRHEFLLRI